MRVIENKSIIKYYGSSKELKTVINSLLHTYSKYQLYKDEKSVSLCKGVLKRVTSKYEINITASLVRAKSIYDYWKSLGYTKVKYKQTNSGKFIIERNNKRSSLRDRECLVSKNSFLLEVNALDYYKSVSNTYTQSEMYFDKSSNTYYVIHTNFLEDLTWSYKDMMEGKFEDFWVQYMVIPDVPKYYAVPDSYKYDKETITLFYDDSDSNYIYGWYTFPAIIYFDKDAKKVYDECLEQSEYDFIFWSSINTYVSNYTNFVQKVENAWKSIYKHLSKTDEIIDYSDFLVHLKDDSIILSAFKDGVREDVWECHISAFSNEASISTACISTIIELSK